MISLKRGTHHVEGVSLESLAREVGTPTYVYSANALRMQLRGLSSAFEGTPHLVCYSVKASSNLALLALLAKEGAGFDIVSGGELARVQAAGGDPAKVVFAGVGKTAAEMEAALRAGILLFNVESAEELQALDAAGRRAGRKASFALRVNPHVDAKTHPHISTGLRTSKFGIPFEEARALYRRSQRLRFLEAKGLDCHIGSQLTDPRPMKAAFEKVALLYNELRGMGLPLQYLDVGGGLGITYRSERPPSLGDYARLVSRAARDTGATLILEPGRLLVGNAAVLLTRVLYRKKTQAKRFVIVDAGMNDLIRPALYEAHHEISPVTPRRGRRTLVDVVGPICESTDVLGAGRRLVLPDPGALWMIQSAGAYGMTMASNYNSRPRPAEVLVDGSSHRVIRARESLEDLWRGEAV